MRYRINEKNGDSLSILGFGCMRFPKSEAETEKLLLSAIEGGINYFDTAYIYPNSEATLGRIFAKNNCREKVNIATKLPFYMTRKKPDIERFWKTQLERLQTDYIDYYLIHMLTEHGQWEKLRSLDIESWIADKKSKGSIRNIGFSFHGGNAEFKKLIDAYNWDFCMIQYNYLDEQAQAGRDGLEYAAGKGIPVMIMEPLQGGRLAVNLPKEAEEVLRKAEPKDSPAKWALRWVWNHEEPITVLSGMANMKVLEENLDTAASATSKSLSDSEIKTIEQVRDIIMANTRVPCTGCNYCLPCPQGVDIPLCLSMYNEIAYNKNLKSWFRYITYVGSRNAGKCINCGKCEKRCPQGIKIQAELRQIKRKIEVFPYRQVKLIAKRLMKQD